MKIHRDLIDALLLQNAVHLRHNVSEHCKKVNGKALYVVRDDPQNTCVKIMLIII